MIRGTGLYELWKTGTDAHTFVGVATPTFRPRPLKLLYYYYIFYFFAVGRYKSYPPSVLVDLVARILSLVPPWTRVYRVQRDIPMPLVTSGVEHGNLRELALARMNDLGTKVREGSIV